MWVIPKNYQPSSAFVLATVESKEDLTLLESNIESSLTVRSKPMQLQTCLRKWKRDYWFRHLCTHLLLPSRRTCFEMQLTSSLAGIRASRLARQVSERESQTQDIFGQLFGDIHKQLDLLGSSLKMLKATSRLDSPASSAIWNKMVIEQRGEYSQRAKLARLTKESESASWPTPRASEYKDCGPVGSKSQIHMDKRSYLCAKVKEESKPTGLLNPDWTEWLMGVPIGWTELGSWGTE